MKKRYPTDELALPAAWLPTLQTKVREPACIILGSPRQAVELVEAVPLRQPVLYQMDLYQAERTAQLLEEHNIAGTVAAKADLWDLDAGFQSAVFIVEPTGERMLKLDMIEQAYHVLKPQGTLLVLSRQDNDQFFPGALKKIYGRVHSPQMSGASVLWCQREEERSRRRHEVTFHVRGGTTDDGEETEADAKGPSLRFLSRPGVFSYGRFDHGARALVETAVIQLGDAVLDLGCGCGTNGVICGLRGGSKSHVTFVDSNCRATVLADLNATENGVINYDIRTCHRLVDLPECSFDVVLANPPYFANLSIAERFITESRPLMKQGGRFYLVTKQPGQLADMVLDTFGPTEAVERRGYIILCAVAS
jgi:16S rRNA G1207 methylase RsmC